jgi:hypothetical protein
VLPTDAGPWPDPVAIPLLLKLAWTAFVAVLIPIYWRRYGVVNFLWFSDIALFGSVAALWLESALIASMMAVGTLLPELFWNASFFLRLLGGSRLLGLTDYMFDRKLPRYLRALSLFHVALPPLLLWLLATLGYDARALWAQTLLAWVVLPLTFALRPEKNINWVYGFGDRARHRRPRMHLAFMMLFFPLCIHLPAHLVLGWLFEPA